LRLSWKHGRKEKEKDRDMLREPYPPALTELTKPNKKMMDRIVHSISRVRKSFSQRRVLCSIMPMNRRDGIQTLPNDLRKMPTGMVGGVLGEPAPPSSLSL